MLGDVGRVGGVGRMGATRQPQILRELDMDFVQGRYALNGPYRSTLPAGWAFTRATPRTAPTAAGVVTAFASGAPAITDAGLSIEEARTNLLLNSAVLVTQGVTVAAVPYVLSFHGTGTVTLSGAATDGPLVGTGAANRVSLAFTPTAGTLTLTVAGSVTVAQLEAGEFATTPITTTGAAATRNKDEASVAALSPLLAAPFVVYVEAGLNAYDLAHQRIVQLDDGTTANRLRLSRNGSGVVTCELTSAGAAQTTAVSAAKAGARTLKGAVLLEAGSYRAALDGVASAAVAVTNPTGLARLLLGITDTGASPLNGTIRRVRIIPGTMSGAQLAALTA